MYEWLKEEIASVNTLKFFVVDGHAPDHLRQAIEPSDTPVPPSYKAFVREFGDVALYRQGGIYLVQVFANCVEAESSDGEPLLQFGRTDMSLAYFKEFLLMRGQESPVFESHNAQGLRQSYDNFEQWLMEKCSAARAQFKKKEWEDIEQGPKPFSTEERKLIEARRRFRWRVVGISPNGNLRFEVHNASTIVLPYLSIGIRGKLRSPKSGPLNGGIWLPVSSVLPGETRIIEKDCYKDVVDPGDIEAFEKPDPEPEDRDRYWEFKNK